MLLETDIKYKLIRKRYVGKHLVKILNKYTSKTI